VAEYVVGTLDELPPGASRLVPEAGKFGIGVFNIEGEFYALANYCPHQGAPLCAGHVTGTTSAGQDRQVVWQRKGEILRCPWHSWEFDIKTGRTVFEPTERIRTYAVRVVGDDVILDTARSALEAG
jgi:nitrite reductase/ring-hydroxylating ferredoxin subunit